MEGTLNEFQKHFEEEIQQKIKKQQQQQQQQQQQAAYSEFEQQNGMHTWTAATKQKIVEYLTKVNKVKLESLD